jgi:hypothetical protein
MIRALTILATIVALAVSASAASAGTSTVRPPRGPAHIINLENTMISGYAVSNSRQGLVPYNGHAGLGANAARAPQSGATGAAAASQGIIMRDGGICDPIRHMGC